MPSLSQRPATARVVARSAKAVEATQPDTSKPSPFKVGTLEPFQVPPPNPEWSDQIRSMYESYTQSGMHKFAQASDYAILRMTLDQLHERDKMGVKRLTGAEIKEIYVILRDLGFTEAGRRAMKVELVENTDNVDEIVKGVSDALKTGGVLGSPPARLKAV